MPRADVAIYAPYASQLYDRQVTVSGGAELQTVMLAEGLADRGLSCAHIVLPMESVRTNLPHGVELVQRAAFAGRRPVTGKAEEVRIIWRALVEADAETYIFRSAWPALGVASAFCRRRNRRLVFASASDRDFTLRLGGFKRIDQAIHRHGARRADAIVVQTEDQADLARGRYPSVDRIVEIPSFAEPAELSKRAPEAFLWTGRLIGYKNPEAYLKLARAVPEAKFWMIPKFVEEDPESGRRVQEAARDLPNLELLEARPREGLMELIDRCVAIVNTSPQEGMPNAFLEGWARGVPALTLDFDPGGRIERLGLGFAAGGDPQRFAAGARSLWEARQNRATMSRRVRDHLVTTHAPAAVIARWVHLLEDLR